MACHPMTVFLGEGRFFRFTFFGGVGASGVEAASGGNVNRAGNVSGENYLLPFCAGVG